LKEISQIICSCGGLPVERDTTKEEKNKYGCFRDKQGWACCVGAYVCPKCKTRWMFSYEAPDME